MYKAENFYLNQSASYPFFFHKEEPYTQESGPPCMTRSTVWTICKMHMLSFSATSDFNGEVLIVTLRRKPKRFEQMSNSPTANYSRKVSYVPFIKISLRILSLATILKEESTFTPHNTPPQYSLRHIFHPHKSHSVCIPHQCTPDGSRLHLSHIHLQYPITYHLLRYICSYSI